MAYFKPFFLYYSILIFQISNFHTTAGLTPRTIVEKVNSNPQSTWTASVFNNARQKQACVLNDTQFNEGLYNKDNFQYVPHGVKEADIPVSFDGREKWSYCQSMTDIRDQGECGSCWAFGAVEAMSDRICIATEGATQVNISAENLVSCCILCGFGCYGGLPKMAWYYWVHSGIVTGGRYGSKSGCQPYMIPPTGLCYASPKDMIIPTPTCEHKCESNYNVSYNDDKYYGKNYYGVPQNETEIMAEIITYGSIDSLFVIYEDFQHYKSGIYQHMYGKAVGMHSVRLIGWGIEKGEKYWLAANSWGTSFGDGGYFKIRKGVNECGVEASLVAGRYTL